MAGYSLRVMKELQLQYLFFALLLLVCTSNALFLWDQIYPPSQLRALESIWGAWNTSTPDLENNLPGWSSFQEFPCSEDNKGFRKWRGVQCLKNVSCEVANQTTGYLRCDVFITGLTLRNASIGGVLPAAIGNITTLTTLELTENPNLKGALPAELLWDKNLYTLDLHDNAFEGTIPDLQVFKYLQILNLGGNRFTGPFPSLPHDSANDNLQMLDLGRNHLEGAIPENAFENMKQILQLDLSSNKFNGRLPALTLFKKLEILNLSRNAFTGSFLSSPDSDSLRIDSSSLSVLDLSQNQLTSTLDYWNISKFSSLEELYLDNNSISGILNVSHLSELGLLSMKSADSRGLLRVLSLKNNRIDSVVYDDNVDYNISTRIRLEENPYCKSNDNSRFRQQVCLNSVQTSSDKGKIVIIAAVPSAISLLLLIGLVATLYKHRNYKQYSRLQMQRKFEEFDVKPTIFPYNQLRTATRDFHSDMKLGQGAFGAVYKGIFPNGNIMAVKQLFERSKQGIDQFLNEVVLLTGMKHRNLVNLKGCCIHEQQRLLVYEYVDNYDIDKLLLAASANKTLLSWPVRFKICLGVARGLHYLHAFAHPKIIHRDIKASNILLAKNNEVKIADFGLALLFPEEHSCIITKHVAGTKGYLAPEYASFGQLCDKADVFSFGVLCLEVVSGRRNIDEACSSEKLYLPNWAWDLLQHEKLMDLVDPHMSLQVEEKLEVHRVINIALLCIQDEAKQRPSMERVVAMLQGENEGEVVPLKVGNNEQYLFAFGKDGLGIVKEEGESSLMDSARQGGGRLEDNDSNGESSFMDSTRQGGGRLEDKDSNGVEVELTLKHQLETIYTCRPYFTL